MFPQFKKLNNESGIILFIVLMTAIIIMMISVGILTQSMNEINYAQQQIDQIAADQLSKGIFWNQTVSGPPPSGAISITLSGRTYITNITSPTAGTYNITTNYDTF